MDKILIVDDDLNILKLLCMRLETEGYIVDATPEFEEALKKIEREDFSLALVDLKLKQRTGIELMEAIHNINPEMPIIILTAYGTIKSAVEAMKKGAYTYLTKPFDFQELSLQIKNAIEKAKLSREVKRLREIVKGKYEFTNIVGKSEAMKRLLDLVSRAAQIDSNVYLQGESGTGKGLIAKALHLASKRKDGPFVAINCAAIPETLLESELFGFEKGAFTGAIYSKKGLFVQANNGTLFLDEISEIPLSMQAKLLQALEEKKFYPLGGELPVEVDVRIIAASNKDLKEEVKKGNFRDDLFYRIHVIPIKIPPLRERKEDIPLLANFFLKKNCDKMNKNIKGFSAKALKKMMMYSWPGNVRELENAVECAVAICIQDVIPEDLILPTQRMEEDMLKPLKEAKSEFEKNYLIHLLQVTQGNVSQAAKLAHKYRADFYKLLEKYHIDPKKFRKNFTD